MSATHKVATDEAESRIGQCRERGNKDLDLSGIGLTVIPDGLRDLNHIRILNLSNNQIRELPNWLGELTELNLLDLTENALATLPESIGALAKLESLHLSFNRIRTLPASMARLRCLHQLALLGNPEIKIPNEILRTFDAQLIVDFYARTSPDEIKVPLNEFKLVLVGRGLVGKTTLVHKLIHGDMGEYDQTFGVKVSPWSINIDGSLVRAHVWDFGGQDILHGTHRFFMTERALYLVLVSGREANEDYDSEYWLSLVRSFAGEVPIIVLLHKWDDFRFELNRKLLRKKYGDDLVFLETDSSTGHGINGLREKIVELAKRLPGLKAPWPAQWHSVKQYLPEENKSWLTFADFRSFCSERGVERFEDQEALAASLHELGLMLSYKDEELRDIGVLNPRWVTEGIYAVLNASAIVRANGRFNLGMLSEILPDTGPRVFSDTDILDANGLAEKLLESPDPVSRHVCRSLSEQDRDLIARHGTVASIDLRHVLASVLTKVVLGKALYAEHRFQHISLRDETKDLLLRRPKGVHLEWCNRLLLEDAYPSEIRRVARAKKQYPTNVHPYLIALMRKFRLCHPVDDRGHNYLIPELLTKLEPELENEFLPEHCLGFVYRYDSVLPEGMLPRFIVETYVHREPKFVWRTGVVLERANCRALVRGDVQGRTVSIWITGTGKGRRELLGIIREHFERIHKSYEMLPVTEFVPVPGHPSATIPYRLLLQYEREGRNMIPVDTGDRLKDFSVTELLDGVDLPDFSRMGRQPDHRPLRLFISYSHKDDVFMDELRGALVPYERTGELEVWADPLIEAGELWEPKIFKHLNRAEIVVLLLSHDFVRSYFCMEKELATAIQRQERGERCEIVPVVIRACRFDKMPLGKIQAILPSGRPIDEHQRRDRAWVEVTKQLDRVIARIKLQ
jgi:small GTP-binding protein